MWEFKLARLEQNQPAEHGQRRANRQPFAPLKCFR